jgi:predicted lipoprotein with Yx(FWY)xxD motif
MKNIVYGLVILCVLAIVGYGGYSILFNHKSTAVSSTQVSVPHKTMRTEPTVILANSVYKVMPSGKLGHIFTDLKGMTLYTYKKDTSGVSHCMGGCLKVWPPYTTVSQPSELPSGISVVKRTDGTLQYAYKDMPLYYFSNDKKAGDVNGEGIGNLWFVVSMKN